MKALPLLVSYEAKPSVVKAMATDMGLSDDEKAEAVTLMENGLPPLTNRNWIPFLFGISPRLIGSMEVHSHRYYRFFQIRKTGGGKRDIETPRRYLKTIQRWLLFHIIQRIPVSDDCHGFVPERSIFTNGARHVNNPNILVCDILNFFPSVTLDQVRYLLRQHLPYGPSVITQIARLCTLYDRLPQGAPTSPWLANSAFSPADRGLKELAVGWGAEYTRYADDMAFSSNRRFERSHLESISSLVNNHGFLLNTQKSRRFGPGQRQIVAGMVVNAKVQPPRNVRKRWRAMFHRASLHPREFAERASELAGIAAFIKQYDPDLSRLYSEIVVEVEKNGEINK